MLRTRFSLWRSQIYWRILCAVSKQFREFADTSKALAAAQAESKRWKAQHEIVVEKLVANQRDLETAQRAAQNALNAASQARAECERAQRGEIEALRQVADNLKATVNSLMYASGSQLPMYDGVGPTKPPSKWDGKPIAPVNGKQHARTVARQAEHEFLNQLASQIPQEVQLTE